MSTISKENKMDQKKKRDAELRKFLRDDLQVRKSAHIRWREVSLALMLLKRQHKKNKKEAA